MNKRVPILIVSLLISFSMLLALSPYRVAADSHSERMRSVEFNDDAHLISSAEELIALASRVNSGDPCEGEYFQLSEDIVLNDISDFDEWSEVAPPENIFIPIGDGIMNKDGEDIGNYFGGIFDGCGHSITGAYILATAGLRGVGIFGNTLGGEIRNLTIDHCYIPENARSVGGLVGKAQSTIIENCTVSGKVNGVSAVGGIVGELVGGSLSECTAAVTVRSELAAAAAVGSCGNANISRCRVLGSVHSEQYAGGIVGICDRNNVSSCVSECAVSGETDVGAISGFCFYSSFNQCLASGNVGGNGSVGGIVGICQNTQIVFCRNTAIIDGDHYVGGAAGRCSATEIIGFINSGEISGNDYVGGIAGWSDSGTDFGSILPKTRVLSEDISVFIRSCFNEGTVSGEWGVGGIVGDCHETEIRDCYNAGEIVSLQYAGGITGYTADCIIERSYNAGSVRASYAQDALIGRNSMDRTDVNNCYYLNTSCAIESEHGTELTHEQMMLQESYEGFDFSLVWLMDEATDYPYAELRALSESANHIPGDIDGNGSVAVADAVLALRASMGLAELEPEQFFSGDIDGNGEITVFDAIIIMRVAIGLETLQMLPVTL